MGEIVDLCEGMFFQGDTMTCLTQWKYAELGETCKALLPKPKDDNEDVDAEKAAWRAKRKAGRNQAIKDIEKETKRRAKEDEKEAKKKAKKAKKAKKEL